MARKEELQKRCDLLLEKLRFWRYVIFGVVSGIAGIVASGKSAFRLVVLVIIGVVILALAIRRISELTQNYEELLEKLRDTE